MCLRHVDFNGSQVAFSVVLTELPVKETAKRTGIPDFLVDPMLNWLVGLLSLWVRNCLEICIKKRSFRFFFRLRFGKKKIQECQV